MHTVLSVGPISSVLYNPHSNSFRIFALSLGFSIQVQSTNLFGWIYNKLHIAIKLRNLVLYQRLQFRKLFFQNTSIKLDVCSVYFSSSICCIQDIQVLLMIFIGSKGTACPTHTIVLEVRPFSWSEEKVLQTRHGWWPELGSRQKNKQMTCTFFHLLFVNLSVVCYDFYSVKVHWKKENW
jgi:hypothetical protein